MMTPAPSSSTPSLPTDGDLRRPTVLWIQAGSCGGCTMAALTAEDKGLCAVMEDFGLDLIWHPGLSALSGEPCLTRLQEVISGAIPLDILCVEGSVLTGPDGSGRMHRMAGTSLSVSDIIGQLAARAGIVVAMGSCAAFGGIPAANAQVTGARGVQYGGSDPEGGLLPSSWRSRKNLPVINVAGCAPHPGWITETLAALAADELEADSLDDFARPRFFADHLAHHGCGRNEFYEFKASAQTIQQRGCLMENLGCKATQAVGDCSLRQWNGGGSCTNAGSPCIACTMPGFEAPKAPFQQTAKVAGIPVGLPVDMPKAWFVALAALSKSATPERVRTNAQADHITVPPARKTVPVRRDRDS